MITVYRVENGLGEGPYANTGEGYRPQWMNVHNECSKHPAPWRDFGWRDFGYNWSTLAWVPKGTNIEDFLFGFNSLDAARAWFEPHTRDWLKENGFSLYEYAADEYTMLTGKYQCAFKHETAKRLRKVEL